MSLYNAPIPNFPQIFLTDRNIIMSGGGTHTWVSSPSTGTWTFNSAIYLNWFAGRLHGTGNYNTILPQSVVIPLDSVAYVTINPNASGAVPAGQLTINVVAGTSLQKGDNLFVLAMHRDLGYGNNPVTLRNGVSIPNGGSWSATGGGTVTGFAGNYSGTSWAINHALNSTDVSVSIQDNSSPRKLIHPENVFFVDANNASVTFSESVTGRAVIMKGNAI